MSYYSRLELEWNDIDQPMGVEPEAILERARVLVRENDYSDDLLEDLGIALQGSHNQGIGFNKMYSDLMIEMVEFLSRGFPKTIFRARGTGEELLDTWIREFKNGEVTLSYGPWDT